MQTTLRFGDREAAKKYPLPVSVAPLWRVVDGVVVGTVHIPPCPDQHIMIPSVSIPGEASGFRCALEIGDHRWALDPVACPPHSSTPRRDVGAETELESNARAIAMCSTTRANRKAISTHIDCFHTESDVPQSRLLVRLARPNPPKHFLVTLSIRPLRIEPKTPLDADIALPQPTPLSQMLAPASIRRRICSPTALTMALRAAHPDIDWHSVIHACFDGRFYGSWPLAIRCAGLAGRLGAAEAVASWESALTVLRAGSPIVASIRFRRGELPGAPLSETGGHLVAIYGVRQNRVLACDPAAPNIASVPRSYDLTAFTNTWLRHRGATYFLAPH